ncbi:MAG: DNA-directed RNA polymerase subunit H [Thermoproteaceae archaeon]|nr:DNA-directed RNA polymerase subunit H [Thermoproteaceae archaeon]
MGRIVIGVKDVSVIPREQAKELLKKLRLKPWQLPWIRASDPLVKYAGARPGDILKIVEEFPTAEEVVCYRLVVPG